MKEKVKNDSNINIKQILIIIFFILVIIIGIYANNYNENNNTNEQSIISYTLDTIKRKSSKFSKWKIIRIKSNGKQKKQWI